MAKYKAYTKYKDSGMEWCTVLPVGWKRANLRWLSSIYAGGTPSKNVIDYWENGTVPWINSGAVNQSYITEPSTFISKAAFENSSAKWIPKGALVVALAGQGKTKGMVAQLGINTTCNQSMAAIVFPKKSLSRYIYWWLTSNYQNIRNMAGGDLRDGLNLELLGDIQCPQPNDGECVRISAFLDHETAKIDNLIEKQQQLIELLKEKRQAVISHAITKGLNPDAPMKDSGVEWLGDVPEHWKRSTPIKYLSSLKGRLGWQGLKADEYRDEGPYVVSSAHFNNYEIDWNSCPRVSLERYKLDSNIQLDVGDILLMKDGAAMGKLSYVDQLPGKACLNSHLLLFRPLMGSDEKTYDTKFMFYLMQTNHFQSFIKNNGTGSTFLGISQQAIGNHSLCLPPYNEQVEISNYLDDELSKIVRLETMQLEMKNLLTERRTALISAAVTGKIDVRDWVAPDTQVIEEPQEATA